ncbi:MAG: citrate lyase beta subunit [Magnetococcales bacterium]|nr:citrate lyase beta subunit [Magnetococcales bacterium]
MNVIEYEMLDVLKELRDKYGAVEIKAEFEAEGSRMEEMMRLKDLSGHVGMPIIMKIGGVEAVTDVYNALSLGVKGIIAPMAETSYAVSKFTNLIDQYVAEDNARDIEFAVNLETITAHNNIDDILSHPNISKLTGVTVGRVDLVGSMGLSRSAINSSKEVETICRTIFSKAKEKGLKTGMGGGIDKNALVLVQRMHEDGLLDKYETRKISFPASSASYGEPSILTTVKFELLWLKSKRRYYSGIKSEDEKRILMLEERLK